MANFKFQVLNPLLHNELRLQIIVALDSLESADFMYLCQITGSTRGNLSTQITTLKEAEYIKVTKFGGLGRASRTVCRITDKGRKALKVYEEGLRKMFTEKVPQPDQEQKTTIG